MWQLIHNLSEKKKGVDYKPFAYPDTSPSSSVCDKRAVETASISDINSFQLLEIIADKQDLSFVQKVLVSESQISTLCNKLLANSAALHHDKVTHLDITALDSKIMTVVGFYGDNTIIAKIFTENNLASNEFLDRMDNNLLKPGLYACKQRDMLYLFYWNERKQPTETASRKDVTCNFVRYLIELCEVVYICIDGKRMEQLSPQSLYTSTPNSVQRNDRFKIAKRNESEDDLRLHDGFTVDITTSCRGQLGLMISQGLYRCVVVACTVNPCQQVLREEYTTGTIDKLRSEMLSLSTKYSVDCSSLPDKDFLLLLEVLGKQRELGECRKVEEARRKSSAGLMFKNKETLMYSTGERRRVDAHALQHELLKFECQLCSIWELGSSDNQEFLFPGTKIEVVHAATSMQDTNNSMLEGIFQMDTTTFNSSVSSGPIVFGQEVVLIAVQESSSQQYPHHFQEFSARFLKPGIQSRYLKQKDETAESSAATDRFPEEANPFFHEEAITKSSSIYRKEHQGLWNAVET